MAQEGKLVLPNWDGMDFVPLQIEEPKLLGPVPAPTINSCTLDLIKGDVTVQLDIEAAAERIVQIAAAL